MNFKFSWSSFVCSSYANFNHYYYINCVHFTGPHSTDAYKKFIAKIEKFTRFFCIFLSISIGFLFFSVLPYSLVRYYIFDMGEDSFYLYCPSWFVFHSIKWNELSRTKINFFLHRKRYPFNWKSPAGYLVAWMAQWVVGPTSGSLYIQFPNIFFASCWLFMFIAEDITQDVLKFNTIVTTTSDETCAELTKRFCDTVHIYSDAKE